MNRAEANMIERSAFAIYCEFIRHGSGSLSFRRDPEGKFIRDDGGGLIPETHEQACRRRWNEATETTRESFRREAAAALRAAA